MTTYRGPADAPALVAEARAPAGRLRFPNSCSDDFGRLWHALVAHVTRGRTGELGAGCGVGTAWAVAALAPAVHLISAERHAERAAAVRDLLRRHANVRVLEGDWRMVVPEAPCALLFADVGDAKRRPDEVLALMEPRGLVIMDDMTPEAHWPPEWQGRSDPVRDVWFNRDDVAVTEIILRAAGRESALLAARRA